MTDNTPPSRKNFRPKEIAQWLSNLVRRDSREDDALKDALEEYIEELSSAESEDAPSEHERVLLTNMLQLRDYTVTDVMIPRADIVALEADSTKDDIAHIMQQHKFSRYPVFAETLDDVLGVVHIKDMMAVLMADQHIHLRELTREAPIVSPSLPVLDLLLLMKQERKHLAFVIDEYGGIDGMVTISDVVENIIGDIQDEHDLNDDPVLSREENGSYIVEGRVSIDDIESIYGAIVSDEQREDIETVAGFLFTLAGRVPVRGEVIAHEEKNLVFEILEADPRRVKKVRIRIPDAPLKAAS
jgi:magnesium and cobalt transporter